MKLDYTTMLNEMNGAIRWRLVETAISLKIFDYTENWQNAKEISANLGTYEAKTELFLDALSSCGYLIKYCQRYKNSDISNKFLKTDSDIYHGKLIISLGNRRLSGTDNIAALLKGDNGKQIHLKDEKVWINALENLIPYQKAIADKVVDIIEALDGSENFRSMLDMGGGPGCLGQAVRQRMKGLSLTLFDLPKVIELAKQNAVTDEMDFISGSYSNDSIGNSYDIIWASRSLYYAENLKGVIKKTADALNPGGYLICLHEGLCNERTEPQEVILNRIGVALQGSDVSFERGEIEDAIKESGLKLISVISSADVGGNADIITARKI